MSLHDFNFRRPAPDQQRGVTAAERWLIDLAIAAGRVKVIPTGKTAIGYRWCEKTRRIIRVNAEDQRHEDRWTKKRDGINAQRAEEARARVAEIKRMRDLGMTNDAISKALGINKDTVRKALRRERQRAEAGDGVK